MPEPGLERGLHGRGGTAVGVAGGGDQRRLERRQLLWRDGVSHSPAAGAERTNFVVAEYVSIQAIQDISSKPAELGESCGDDGSFGVHLCHAHMVKSKVEAGVYFIREHDYVVLSTYRDQRVQLLS